MPAADGSFLEFTLSLQEAAEVAVRPSVVGIQQQRLAQTGDGFVQPALVREEAAEVIMRFGKVGPEPDRLADIGKGEVAAAQFSTERAEQIKGVDVPGIRLQNIPTVLLRLLRSCPLDGT